ncbi:MAG: ATP-binding cassette domain-containing protein [Opitutales bacterium]
MIELKDINFSYTKDKAILSNFSMNIARGEFCSILGLNGIGKSTLIKIIAGYLKANSGSVEIAKKDIKSYSSLELAKIRSVLEQESELNFSYSVKEVVALGLFGYNSNSEFLEEIMQKCEILELANRDYTSLSGGEKRRVSLARAIIQIYAEDMSDKILFLDEPSASLDPKHTILIMKLAKELQSKKCTVISILHDPNLAYTYSDKIVGISDAKLAFSLSPQEFMQEDIISKLYNCPCQILKTESKTAVIF